MTVAAAKAALEAARLPRPPAPPPASSVPPPPALPPQGPVAASPTTPPAPSATPGVAAAAVTDSATPTTIPAANAAVGSSPQNPVVQPAPKKRKKQRRVVWIIEESSSDGLSSDDDSDGTANKKNTEAVLNTRINLAANAGGTNMALQGSGPGLSTSGTRINNGFPVGDEGEEEDNGAQQFQLMMQVPQFEDLFGPHFPFHNLLSKKDKKGKKKKKGEKGKKKEEKTQDEQVGSDVLTAPEEVIRLEIVDVTPGSHKAGGQPIEEAEQYTQTSLGKQVLEVEREMSNEAYHSKFSYALLGFTLALVLVLAVVVISRVVRGTDKGNDTPQNTTAHP
ncbi:cell division protein ZipA-like [Ornithodoros turicata]|uniref:cell division protein ZipA-like n=1 Tax=Ornithodoros turicata TaxID=34597 RepID=UPI003139F6CB